MLTSFVLYNALMMCSASAKYGVSARCHLLLNITEYNAFLDCALDDLV